MKKSIVVLLHAGYWIIFLFLLLMFFAVSIPMLSKYNANRLSLFIYWSRLMLGFAIIPAAVSFYTFYSFLFPSFLARKKILLLTLLGIAVAAAAALIGGVALSYILFTPKFMFIGGSNSAIAETVMMFFIALINGIIALVMKGFIKWYADIKYKSELNKKNFETEMALIKSQLDPHFLFNTINNIDVLIEKDPVAASAYLNKLSGIMRFMLYETKADNIPLEKELLYIEKYLDLQKIRTANKDYVHYEVVGNPAGKMIAPMLFIPFIENAFKHADNPKTGIAIKIIVEIFHDRIIFNCENNSANRTGHNNGTGGLGSSLIEKRVALLYPGTHALSISNNNNLYTVQLIINAH